MKFKVKIALDKCINDSWKNKCLFRNADLVKETEDAFVYCYTKERWNKFRYITRYEFIDYMLGKEEEASIIGIDAEICYQYVELHDCIGGNTLVTFYGDTVYGINVEFLGD